MEQFTLDTNIYISYFIDRDETQYRIASSYIKKLEEKTIFIFLPGLIVAEIIYILAKGYAVNRENVAHLLSSLIYEDNLITEDKNLILSALEIFETTTLDFADCYLLALAETKNTQIVTFDKRLQNKKL